MGFYRWGETGTQLEPRNELRPRFPVPVSPSVRFPVKPRNELRPRFPVVPVSPSLTIRAIGRLRKSRRGGKNDPQDVAIVQKLLNYVAQWEGIPEEPLKVDGIVGPKTLRAIVEFQENFCQVVDGRVDPNKTTINMLNAMAEPLPRFNN